MPRAPLFFLISLLFACSSSGEPAPTCPAGYLGRSDAPIEMDLRAIRADYTDVPLADGDDLAMLFPPQGGRVVFVGVRATNLDGCGLKLTGAVRDPTNRQVRVDARTVNLEPTGDGWGASTRPGAVPQIASYANVPLCPNQWSSASLFDATYELSVTLEDRQGKRASRTIHVNPRCAEPENASECACICKRGYVVGEACADDGGVDAMIDATEER